MPEPERRAERIWSSIRDVAQREGPPVSPRHICLACAEAITDVDVALSTTDRLGSVREFVAGSDPRAEELEELQSTLGEGPGVDVVHGHGPLLVPDLGSVGSRLRWPIFTAAAEPTGVRAMFAFPIRAGAAGVGVLDLYRNRTGRLLDNELADALGYADAALALALDLHSGVAPRPEQAVDDLFTERRANVHQASGMVSVQLGISIADALARLRAHAYANDRRLADLAADVVDRNIRFHPDTGDGRPEKRDTEEDPTDEGDPTREDVQP